MFLSLTPKRSQLLHFLKLGLTLAYNVLTHKWHASYLSLWILCCTLNQLMVYVSQPLNVYSFQYCYTLIEAVFYILDVWLWFAGSLAINTKRSQDTVDIECLYRVMTQFCTNISCCVSIAKQLLKENIHILTIVKRIMNHVKTLLCLFPCYN